MRVQADERPVACTYTGQHNAEKGGKLPYLEWDLNPLFQ
jgi:hypothetical protein